MFRDQRRIKQKLSHEECIELLKNEKRAVLSVLGDDDYPYGMPVNHFYNEEDGKIYIHGSKRGHKIDAIKRHDKVSLCVHNQGYQNEGEWAYHVKSVIVFGRIELISNMDKAIDICVKLSHKFTDDKDYIEYEINKNATAVQVLAITPEHISGKAVTES